MAVARLLAVIERCGKKCCVTNGCRYSTPTATVRSVHWFRRCALISVCFWSYFVHARLSIRISYNFVHPLLYYLMYEIKKYEVGVTSNGKTFMPYYVQIGYLVQKVDRGNIYTKNSRGSCKTTFIPFKLYLLSLNSKTTVMATAFHSVWGHSNFWYTVSHIISYIKYSYKITRSKKYWIFKTKLHIFVYD